MTAIKTVLQYVFVIAVIGGSGYVLWNQAAPLLIPPCSTPITYSIGSIDPRYSISETQFETAIQNAAAVWNTEAGKPVLEFVPMGGMPVNLIYTPEQQTATLGKAISAQQAVFDDAKAKLDTLKDRFDAMKSVYDPDVVAFNAKAKAYQDEVASWNNKGGAPPPVYAQLQAEQRSLKEEERALNAEAASLNSLSSQINAAVNVLNAAAKEINANVNVYNKDAGNDFEQGEYKVEGGSKRISIFEYKNSADLTRVLAHEFGHAIGLEHVENPASIMYSYNIGKGLALSAEDIAELKKTCHLD